MLRNNRLLLTVFLCLSSVLIHAQEKITLDEAINIALSESNTIKIADMKKEKKLLQSISHNLATNAMKNESSILQQQMLRQT